MPLVVGIDIGGTKTHARALREDGSQVADRSIGTDRWRLRNDPDEDAERLVGFIRQLLNEAGQLEVLVVGSHGCDTDTECQAFTDRLARKVAADVLVLNDAELLLAATGFPEGISVVAGTGSIAVTRDRNHRLVTAGGWGWFLGDEGGATGLVRRAAQLICAAQDRGEQHDPLISSLCAAYGAHPGGHNIGAAISRLGNAASIGEHAPVIFEALRNGSKLARQVLEEDAAMLADKVALLVQRGAAGQVVVTGGGVIAQQAEFAEAFARELARKAPGWRLEPFSGMPVVGAVTLALRILEGGDLFRLPTPRHYEASDD